MLVVAHDVVTLLPVDGHSVVHKGRNRGKVTLVPISLSFVVAVQRQLSGRSYILNGVRSEIPLHLQSLADKMRVPTGVDPCDAVAAFDERNLSIGLNGWDWMGD